MRLTKITRSATCLSALSFILSLSPPALSAGAGADSDATDGQSKPAKTQLAQAAATKTASNAQGHRARIGLALGGGGSRGAAHVAVLKVLEKEGVPIDCIAGTSIGSVVGGLYAAGVPLNKLEEQFTEVKIMKAFMTVPLWVRLAVAPIMVIPRLWKHPYDGLYKGNKFRNYLMSEVPDESEKKIEDLKIPYSAVAVSLVDGYPHRLSKGNLGYAMQASCAVPGLRKPVEIGNDLYCDGGVAANVPVKMCREMGADIVIAVNIDEPMFKVPLDTFRRMGSVSQRLIKLQLRNSDEPECAAADVVIHPNLDGISLITTRKEDAIKGLKAGEEAAKAALPAIRKKLAEAGINLASATRPQ